jgi:hypothetical protein
MPIMVDGQLSLEEFKERAKALGRTNIQRQIQGAPIVGLAAWPGVSPLRDGSAHSLVSVWYRLEGDQVAIAHRTDRPDVFYVLS